tara:strand:- start:178 stop:408 length:231 start_codon:yes stop_codon:yes gene_type:complete
MKKEYTFEHALLKMLYLLRTRATPTRLSWGKAIWGPTEQPTNGSTDKVSYRVDMIAPKNLSIDNMIWREWQFTLVY